MSHSRVFQFERFKKSDFDENDIEVLNENTLEESQFPPIVEYWRDCDDIEDIKEDFKYFVAYGLPEGMFEMNEEEMSLTYIKRPDDYIKKYIDTIKTEANKLSFEDGNLSTWRLQKTIENFGNMYMVYSSEVDYPRYVKDWILEIAECEKIGAKFYLGGVLSYRY